MGRKRNQKRNKKLKNGKMKMSNSNTNKQNEKPKRTDDSGTSSEDDREDSTQRSSLEEAEKNKSDHDMSPNEKEGKEMEALGENDGNDNDDHCGKKPFETPRSEVCEVENSDKRNNHLNNEVNEGTESNNEQSTSEEGKSSKAEISTKYDDADKIEITVTSGAKSDDVDPSPQSFQTSETELDSIDTEEQHRDNNTIKIEKGKQADHNRMDKIESQTEHMNMDANQQNAEDGERTNDIAMTQSNNDQTTPEEDQPKHMERTAESIGVNGEKTVVGVSPLQSFQTGHIKDDQMDGTEERHQHGHVDGIEERHQHVDGTEEQHQHRHVNSDVEQQNGQNAMFQDDNTDGRNNNPRNNVNDGTESNNDQSTSEEGKSRKAEITTESDGANKIETTVTSDAKSDDPSQQSFQTPETNHDGIDTEEQHCDNNTIKIEEGKQADRNCVDEIESQTEHEHMNMDANQQKGEDGGITNDITMTQSNNDQTTPEKDQPIHMERTTESIGVNGEKIGVCPSQSFHTGDIKDNQMDNDSTSTKTDTCYNEDEPMSSHSSEYGTDRGSDETPSSNASLNPQKKSRGVLEEDTSTESNDVVRKDLVREETVVASDAKSGDDSPSQSVRNENIEHDNINSEEMQHSASPTTIGSPNTSITMTPVQGLPSGAFDDDVGDPGLRNGEMSVDENEAENNNVMAADKFENEVDSFQSPTSGTNMAYYQGSDETHNFFSDIQNQSREVSGKNTSAESNDVLREDVVVETTVVASDGNSGDDYTSQSVQNENIDHSNINSEEMQRSASLTTIESPNTSITTTLVQGQPSGAFVDDVGDPGLRNGELSLYENETENDNVVNADNFENEMDSPQSSESGNDMVHYEGSNEILSYNLLSDIQLKTSQEKEIEKLQRELNIKNENLVTLQEEMKRRDEIINKKNSENADLLHRCVASETSAEAADDLREQCEDKNHQIETLEGDLASVRNENESLKRHLEETENVAAYNQRLIDENKSLNEYLEQERQSSAALKEEAQALKEQITNKEDVLKELKSQIKKAIEEKKELGAKLASRNENNSDLLSNNLEMKKKEEELAAELKKMQENYQYEKRRSEELSGQLSLKNKEVTTTENKYKQEMEELKAKYKTEKDQAEKEKELLKQRVTKLTEGSQQLQAENKRIKDDLQLKSMECGNLKSERLRITRELDAAKKEIAELSNDRDKLGAYITTVNDEIRELKAALELKEAEKNAANECMQKVVREKQEMMYSMGNLQRIELENHQLKRQNMGLSEQITKLHASLQEYGLLRDHIQEYYKAFQDSQIELEREKEKSRHINELLSKTGYRLDSMASELNNYRTTTEGYRRSLEEEKEKSNKLERKLDRLTIDNEKLTEERDKCEQKSFEYKDECRSLREDLEKSQAECRDLLSQTQEGASDGTTSLLQGNYFTSTPMGNGFGKPSSQSNFVFGIGGDKMNRKK